MRCTYSPCLTRSSAVRVAAFRVGRPSKSLAMITLLTAGIARVSGQQTVAPGPYTATQAESGRAAYQANCEGCHRHDFQGEQDAKPLAGGTFRNAWRTRTTRDLFTRINATMPPDAPGSVGDENALNIVALLLQVNGVPSGTEPLTAETTFPLSKLEGSRQAGNSQEAGSSDSVRH